MQKRSIADAQLFDGIGVACGFIGSPDLGTIPVLCATYSE
jgi:hypothetical protein